jgi:hypothetical protein
MNSESGRKLVGACLKNARKTKCMRGHPLEGENLYVYEDPKDGPQRFCRECRKIRRIESIQRRKTPTSTTFPSSSS